MKKISIIILLFLIITTSVTADERRAAREKNFILRLYNQKYYREVLDGLDNSENLYKRYMDADLYLVKAESHYNLGDYEKAIENYIKCLEASDKYERYAKFSIGYSNMELGRFIKALEYFRELADNAGEHTDRSILNTARIYNKMFQAEESAKYYNRYFEEVKDIAVEITVEYAEVLFNLNKKTEAVKMLESLLEKELKKNEKVKTLEMLAEFKRKSDEFENALKIYDDLIALTGDVKYNYFNGVISFQNSDFKKASEYFSLVTEHSEFGEMSLFYLAQSQYLMLSFEKAISGFEKLTSSSDETVSAKSFYLIAASYFQLRNYNKALEFIPKTKFPGGEYAELRRDIYIAMAKYTEAIEEIRVLLKENVNVANNYYLAGLCYYNMKNFERAIANFELAKNRAQSNEVKHNSIFELGNIYVLQNNFNKAVEEFSLIPQNSSLYREARLKTIDIYRREKKYDEIMKMLDALEKNSKDDFIYFSRAEILYEQGKFDKTYEQLEKIEKSSTYFWRTIILKAEILQKKGMVSEAKKILDDNKNSLDKAYEIDFIYAYTRIAFELEQYDEVINLIENFVSEKGRNFRIRDEIRLLLAEAYLKIRNLSQAEGNALYVAEESDDRNLRLKAQFLLGDIFFSFENFKQAVLEYLKCAFMDPGSIYAAEAYFKAGECYEKLKRLDDAVRSYQKIIDDYKDSEFVKKAEERIKALKI